MTEKLTRAQWAVLSAEVADRIGALVERSSVELPKAGAKLVRPALDKLSLTSVRSTENLLDVLVLYDLQGDSTPLVRGARILLDVPFTGDRSLYEPRSAACFMAYRRLARAGSAEAPEMRSFLSWADNGCRPGDLVMHEATRNRLNQPEVNLCAENIPRPARPNAETIANIIGGLCEFAFLWAYGGSPVWPLDRIDREIQASEELLRSIGAIGS